MSTRHLLAGILLVLSQAPCAHGGPSNDGFTDVVTAPAASTSMVINNIGTFARGVAPVFGTGGLLYLGNEQGTLFAFRPDGNEVWRSRLPDERGIKASPVVGADGSIYVVGVTGRRSRQGTLVDQQATVYKFSPGGGLVWKNDFPAVNQEHGYTTAPPNIWSSGGTKVIMVPAVYRTATGLALHLEAFSTTDGHPLADTIVTNTPETITADGSFDLGDLLDLLACVEVDGACVFLARFSSPLLPDPKNTIAFNAPPPLPGVAVFTFPGQAAPWVIVSDGMHDLVGYTFHFPDQFFEGFRAHDTVRQAASGPMILPDGHSAVGTDDSTDVGRITFSGPNGSRLEDVKVPGTVLGTPSRTANGDIVGVGYAPGGGFVTLLNRDGVLHRGFTTGQTSAAAAVSRTHIFVATASALATFDVAELKPIQLFSWSGGGLWPPAIGPDGRVYAIVSSTPIPQTPSTVVAASNTLFIFPPPPRCAVCVGGVQSGGSTTRLD
jgi:hypothetical protein